MSKLKICSNYRKIGATAMSDKTFAEYFAGIGLVRLGLERAGWRHLYANDFDPRKLEMYQGYFGGLNYDQRNVFDVVPSDVPQSTLATSSFPCIDLSLAGNQSGINGKHSSAFWGFIKILKNQGEDRPPFVMLENVPGWLSSNSGKDFRITVKEINNLGYACDIFSIDAIRFTPQSRERIFLVGRRDKRIVNNIGVFQVRSETLKTSRVENAVKANLDLKWSFLDVPGLPAKKRMGLAVIVEELPLDDPRWWDRAEVKRHMKMMDASHLHRIQSLTKQNSISYRTFFRRRRDGQQRAEVRNQDTAGCLRTARGGSAIQFLIRAGKGRIDMRRMTPREYARLQGVPDDYPMPSNEIQALTGFGDAVAVPVISWIGRNILNPLVSEEPLEVSKRLAFDYGR